MDAAAKLGRNPVSKHRIQPEYGDEQAGVGRGLPNPSRETKLSGAYADREIFTFQHCTLNVTNNYKSMTIHMRLSIQYVVC